MRTRSLWKKRGWRVEAAGAALPVLSTPTPPCPPPKGLAAGNRVLQADEAAFPLTVPQNVRASADGSFSVTRAPACLAGVPVSSGF